MEKACTRRGKRPRRVEDENSKLTIKAKSSQLHDSILHYILLKLPVETLVRFRFLSKSWHDLISSPYFVKSHFGLTIIKGEENKSIIRYLHLSGVRRPFRPNCVYAFILDPQASQVKPVCLENTPFCIPYHNNGPNYIADLRILGSCNGLVLVNNDSLFWLWNPSTEEYKQLRNIRSVFDSHYISGLGYDRIVNEYKVVIFCNNELNPGLTACMYIYTTTGDWRKFSVSNHDFPYSTYETHNRVGLTINGSPHWVVRDSKFGNGRYRSNTIIYFDMVEEKVKMLATPHIASPLVEEVSLELSIVGGCLCATYINLDDCCFDIWAMKQYGVKESWTKLFIVPRMERALRMRPIGFINNGVEIIMEVHRLAPIYSESKTYRGSLVSYNLETKHEKFISSTKIKTAAIVSESLISPQASNLKVTF